MQRAARDVACFRAGEIKHGCGDFFGCAHARGGDLGVDCRFLLVVEFFGHRGGNKARRHAIGGDAA